MSFTHGLQKYIDHPADPLTVFHDDNVVIIRDAFPKALRHYLILPRLHSMTHLHPLDAFTTQVPSMYAIMHQYVEKAKTMMIDSLVAEGYVPDNKTEKASFRNTFIRAGVHSIPSMANLHVHVITQDFFLPRMKNKKHYNSFTTAFFVDFDALAPKVEPNPESEIDTEDSGPDEGGGDPFWSEEEAVSDPPFERRRDRLQQMIRDTPLTCTYCGAKFGLRFAQLKAHLAKEYDAKFPGKACRA